MPPADRAIVPEVHVPVEDVDDNVHMPYAPRRLSPEGTPLPPSSVERFLAGGLAGSVSKSITAPLSRLTILFQVHSLVSTRERATYADSLGAAARKVLQREGFFAFWKGNATSIVHRFPYSAINLVGFDFVRHRLLDGTETEMGAVGGRIVAGGLAGAFACASCYPLDLVRTRLATQIDAKIRYTGIIHAMEHIAVEEGLLGLYQGMGATLAVVVPNLAINYGVYDTAKQAWMRAVMKVEPDIGAKDQRLSIPGSLCCGAVAGVVSSTATYPADVVRRRMQLQGLHRRGKRQLGAWDTFKRLQRAEGVAGLYRGLSAELLKVVPTVGIMFCSFEFLKEALAGRISLD